MKKQPVVLKIIPEDVMKRLVSSRNKNEYYLAHKVKQKQLVDNWVDLIVETMNVVLVMLEDIIIQLVPSLRLYLFLLPLCFKKSDVINFLFFKYLIIIFEIKS